MAGKKAVGKKGASSGGKRKRRGGLGAGGRSLELDRPMGASLGDSVEPPPPPPPGQAALPPAQEAFELPASPAVFREKPPMPERDEPRPPAPAPEVPKAAAPPQPAPPPAPAAPKPAAIKVDLALFPWVIKKQLALETDQEELDFEVIFWIEGKQDRIVLEGHRNDFGQIYVQGPETPPGCWKRYRDSEFASVSHEEVFQTYLKHVVSVLVRTGGFEIEFSGMADFLEWANY